jgi:hypothetical protein
MSLNDDLAADAAYMISADDFGETVTYTPYGNSPVTITAVVDRRIPSRIAEVTNNLSNDIVVTIQNHATLGVTSVQTGRDKITVSPIYGGTPKAMVVTEVLSADAGVWTLKVR